MNEENKDQINSQDPNIGGIFKKFQESPNNYHKMKDDSDAEAKVPDELKVIKSKEKNQNEEVKEDINESLDTKDDSDQPKEQVRNDWKKETEKLKKDLKETQKWAHEVKRQISAYKKGLQKYVEDGILDDQEAASLLDHTKYEEIIEKDKPLILKAADIWDREIENIRKYGNYENIDDHIQAFRHLYETTPANKTEEVLGELYDLMDQDPTEFTKKMLEMGRDYYEDVYSELIEIGDIKNYKKNYEQKISNYEKKIDKLEKEIIKLKERYEDYDEKPNYRIPQGGGNNGGEEPDFMKNPGKLIDRFNSGRHRLTG